MESVDEETDFNKCAWKNKALANFATRIRMTLKNVSGCSNHIKGFKVKFDFGQAYLTEKTVRITKRMLGVHFDDLKSESEPNEAVILTVASSMWMYNFFQLFYAGIFNPDTHARNFHLYRGEVDANGIMHLVIGIFDEQALCRAATENQRKMFVEMLMDGIGAALVLGHNPDRALAESYYLLCTASQSDEWKDFCNAKSCGHQYGLSAGNR